MEQLPTTSKSFSTEITSEYSLQRYDQRSTVEADWLIKLSTGSKLIGSISSWTSFNVTPPTTDYFLTKASSANLTTASSATTENILTNASSADLTFESPTSLSSDSPTMTTVKVFPTKHSPNYTESPLNAANVHNRYQSDSTRIFENQTNEIISFSFTKRTPHSKTDTKRQYLDMFQSEKELSTHNNISTTVLPSLTIELGNVSEKSIKPSANVDSNKNVEIQEKLTITRKINKIAPLNQSYISFEDNHSNDSTRRTNSSIYFNTKTAPRNSSNNVNMVISEKKEVNDVVLDIDSTKKDYEDKNEELTPTNTLSSNRDLNAHLEFKHGSLDTDRYKRLTAAVIVCVSAIMLVVVLLKVRQRMACRTGSESDTTSLLEMSGDDTMSENELSDMRRIQQTVRFWCHRHVSRLLRSLRDSTRQQNQIAVLWRKELTERWNQIIILNRQSSVVYDNDAIGILR